jgi:hypothetical protein
MEPSEIYLLGFDGGKGHHHDGPDNANRSAMIHWLKGVLEWQTFRADYPLPIWQANEERTVFPVRYPLDT